MWSTLLLLFTILCATTLAETVELTEPGGEVPLGDDVTIIVADNKEGSCTFLLQLPKLCCYSNGGDCEGVDQSPKCNAGYRVNPKDGMCVLTLTNFEATDAGSYEAEGKVIVVEAEAESGGNGLTIAVIVIAVLAVLGAAIGGGVWFVNQNNGATLVPPA